MTNNEKFNALLNSCSDPHRIYDALMAMASTKSNLLMLASTIEAETSESDVEII